jgi:hypothetical protein
MINLRYERIIEPLSRLGDAVFYPVVQTISPNASPTSRNGNRITVPTACAVAPNTLSGCPEVVVSVVVVVVGGGAAESLVVVVLRTVSVCSDAHP